MKENLKLVRKIFFLIFVPSLIISPATFLDPINWPKQIALITTVPIILVELFRHFSSLIKLKSLEVKIFISALMLILLAAILNYDNIATTFWGTWGRNNGLATYLSLIAIAFATSFLIRIREFSHLLVKTISISVFPATVYGLIQLFGRDPLDWSVKNTVFSFYGNTNFASAIFALSSLASIFTLFYFKLNSQQRAFYFFQTVASVTVMMSTNSIQGPVAFAVGIAIWLFFILNARNLLLSRIYLFSAFVAGVTIFLGFLGSGPLGSYIFQYTLKLRTFYWLAGIKMGASSPLYGVGVDSYGEYYRQNRSIDTIKSTSIDLTVNNAHNSAIQIFATMGIFGLLSFLMIFFPGIILLVKSFGRRKSLGNESNIPLIILFASSFAMSMISIDNISVAIFTWSLAGACFGIYFQLRTGDTLSLEQFRKNNELKVNKARLVRFDSLKPIVTTALTAFVFFFSWYSSTADRTIVNAYKEPYANLDQVSKDKFVGKLFNFAETFPIFQASHLDYLMKVIARDPNYNVIAAKVSDSAISKFPIDFRLLDIAAVTKENLGRWEEASKIRLKQLSIDPRHPRVRAYYAKDLIELKQFSDVRKQIELSRHWSNEFGDKSTLIYLQQLEKLIP